MKIVTRFGVNISRSEIIIIMDYESKTIEEAIKQEIYKKIPQFGQNVDNMKKIKDYLKSTRPNKENIEYALALLKFYRFPLALCLSQFYNHIKKYKICDDIEVQPKLMEIAAYVKSMLGEMGIQSFKPIQFVYEWGIQKKKYKFKTHPTQIEFGRFIFQLNKQGEELEKLATRKNPQKINKEKLNEFMGSSFSDSNYFAKESIQHIKQLYAMAVMKIQNQEEQEIIPKVSLPSQKLTISNPKSQIDQIEIKGKSNLVISEINENGYIPICCRTSFIDDQVIQQPQSMRIEYKLYVFPFVSQKNEFPTKREKIRRTLCGFLNSQGGIIYFGIKEMKDTHKRHVYGLTLSERSKRQFTDEILYLIKDVTPDIGKKVTLKYVPIKNKQKSDYISGKYVVKVILERGAKNQIYSYKQREEGNRIVEKFAFRTENQVLLINEAQKILKIFKDKIQQPERVHYPTHNFACKQPQLGRPLYQQQYDDDEYQQQQFQNYRANNYRRNEYSEEKVQYFQSSKPAKQSKYDFKYVEESKGTEKTKDVPKKKFMQKDTDELLISFKKQQLAVLLTRQGISYQHITPIRGFQSWSYVKFNGSIELVKAKTLLPQYQNYDVYSRISYAKLEAEHMAIMEEIIVSSKGEGWSGLTRDRGDKVVLFNNGTNAASFFTQLKEMQIFNIEFSPIS